MIKTKKNPKSLIMGWLTGLEPATTGITIRVSNPIFRRNFNYLTSIPCLILSISYSVNKSITYRLVRHRIRQHLANQAKPEKPASRLESQSSRLIYAPFKTTTYTARHLTSQSKTNLMSPFLMLAGHIFGHTNQQDREILWIQI